MARRPSRWASACGLTSIVDINLPDFDGLELTRRLLSRLPKLKVLIFSIHQDAARVRAAFAAGAAGYLSKTSAAAEIETAVRELIAGNGWVSPTVARAVLQPTPPPVLHQGAANRPAAQTKNVAVRGDGLTPREIEILDLLALSLGNKEMAQHLGVSVTTVRTHLSSIYEKLGVDSRVSLALYAAQLHLSAS